MAVEAGARTRAIAVVLGVLAATATLAVVLGAPTPAGLLHLAGSLALVGLATWSVARRSSRRAAAGTLATSVLVVAIVALIGWSALARLDHAPPTAAQWVFTAALLVLLVALGPLGRAMVRRRSTRTDALLVTGALTWSGVVTIPLAASFVGGATWELEAAGPILVAVPLLFTLHLGLVLRERSASARHARHDGVTGLANRTGFRELLDRDLAHVAGSQDGLIVLALGLHRFRVVNDNYGYAAGDDVLRAVAARLTEVLPTGSSIAREDGTTFVACLPTRLVADDPSALVQRVLAEVTAPYTVLGRQVGVGASIGVAVAPEDGTDRESLLRAAEIARQQVKRSGTTNVARYRASMHVELQLQHALETSLQHALARRELSLDYHARIDRRSGTVVAVEALLRWRHPELGAIPPSVFVPVAESCGSIGDLGRYALTEATTQMADWRRRGVLDVPVSVNVSAHQLRDPVAFTDEVTTTLAATGLPADRLELELTESALLPDAPELADALAQLRELGVRLSIDDFGTGYSALAYLTSLSIDGLKIDRSFVATIGADGGAAPVIDAIIALGTSLGLFVVAEGVETETQARYLRSHGCHELQGFLHGRPLPPAVLEDAVRRSRTQRIEVGAALRDADDRRAAAPTSREPHAPGLHGALGWAADTPWATRPDPDAVTRALDVLRSDQTAVGPHADRPGSTLVRDR